MQQYNMKKLVEITKTAKKVVAIAYALFYQSKVYKTSTNRLQFPKTPNALG